MKTTLGWVPILIVLLFIEQVSMYPQQSEISIQKAILLEKEGKLADAEATWYAITKRTPQDAAAWGQLGLVRSQQGKYVAAISAYKQALRLNPDLPGASLDLGLAYFIQQQFDKAVTPLRTAVAAAPDELQPNLLLGMTLYGLNYYGEAATYLQMAVNSAPHNVQLRTTLAQDCLWASRYDCVLRQYAEILLDAPNSAGADILAGEAYDGLNDPDHAIAQFRAAERIAPDDPNVHFGLGYLLWKQYNYDAAAAEFNLELKSNPLTARALAYLGDIAIKQNDTKIAEIYLRRATASPDKTRIAYYDLGTLYAAAGKNALALTEFQHAITLAPDQVDAHYQLARLYRTMGKPSQANSELALVKKLHKAKDERLFPYITKP
jgi:tetratricopeptide (TPR) repeat protein